MTGSAMPERTASASPAAARARAGLQPDNESRPYLRPSLRLSGIVEESIVDGPGLRFVLFTQGCPHGCKGCHNPETHSLEGGFIRDVDELLAVYDENPLLADSFRRTLSPGRGVLRRGREGPRAGRGCGHVHRLYL